MATTTKNFTVLSASAGSGKTYRLALEYIKTALSGNAEYTFTKILAVTFTNKAAEELKDRILLFLENISTGDTTKIAFIQEGTNLSTNDIQQKAKKALEAILNNYSRFAVSTIDTFLQKLIRSFSKDLDLKNNYDIELDTDKVKLWVSQAIIADTGNTDGILDLLKECCYDLLYHDKSIGRLQETIEDISKLAITEKAILHLGKYLSLSAKDFKTLEQKLKAENTAIETEYRLAVNELKNRLNNYGLSASDFKGSTTKNAFLFLDKDLKDAPVNFETKLEKIYDEEALFTKKPASNLLSFYNPEQGFLIACAENWKVQAKLYFSNTILLKNFYSLKMFALVRQKISAYGDENNALLIADFNKIIAESILQENSDFIFEQLGNRYKHIFIDEFQDTSVLQFHNFLPLINNALASGGRVILVGDPKQSIYRFKGGEQELIENLPSVLNPNNNAFIDQEAHALKAHIFRDELTQNFRSKANIIDFNNKLCTMLSQVLSGNEAYTKGHQEKTAITAYGGKIHYRPFFTADGNKSELNTSSLDAIHQDIQELLKLGYDYKDMAFLVSKKAEITDCVEYLIQKGYPVVSNESLVIKNQALIKGILGLLKLYKNSSCSAGKALLLNYLSTEFEHDIFELSKSIFPENKFSSKALNEHYNINLNQLCDPSDVYTSLGNIASALRQNNTAAPSFLHYFFEYSYKLIQKAGNQINTLLQEWDEQEHSIKLSEDLNAIRILTIHKSKGLEFKCVFLPFISWVDKTNSQSSTFWTELPENYQPLSWANLSGKKEYLLNSHFSEAYEYEKNKELTDLCNTMYVACTRAADFLCIHQTSIANNPRSFALALNLFAKENLQTTNNTFYHNGSLSNAVKSQNINSSTDLTYLKNQASEAVHYATQTNSDKDLFNPQYFGNLAHEILAQSKNQNALDINLKKRLHNGQINTEELKTLQDILSPVIQNGESQGWLGANIQYLSELSIIDNNKQVFRPDLISITPSKTFVVDYKTGEPKPEHKTQIDNYAKLLSQMGYENVLTHIEYIKTNVPAQTSLF